jgi:electron transfer flavoprotein beta subunit
VEVWNNEVLQLDPETIGLKGSPTWVSRIFSPSRDRGEIVGDGHVDPEGAIELLLGKLMEKELLPL